MGKKIDIEPLKSKQAEQLVSQEFPFAEIKELLKKHGYGLTVLTATKYPTDKKSFMVDINNRAKRKDGFTSLASFEKET